jgi:predicted RNase H-like nuclease (RuvC/YqgF family)
MMSLKPTEQPNHSEWHRLLAEIEGLVQDRNDLLRIIEAAIPYEHEQQARVEQLEAEIERLELENGGLRQQVIDLEAELRLARALRSLDQRRAGQSGQDRYELAMQPDHSEWLNQALNEGDGSYRP